MKWDTFLNLVKEYSTVYQGFSHYGIMGGLVPLFLTIAGLQAISNMFKYPFFPKYGTLFLSFTRSNKNQKRKSGIVELYFAVMFFSFTINHYMAFGISAIMVIFSGFLEFFDNSKQM